jgi:hypothetical protein
VLSTLHRTLDQAIPDHSGAEFVQARDRGSQAVIDRPALRLRRRVADGLRRVVGRPMYARGLASTEVWGRIGQESGFLPAGSKSASIAAT